MLGISVHRPEDEIVPGGPYYSCHIKSQSIKIADDEAIIVEWSIGEMGHIALSI